MSNVAVSTESIRDIAGDYRGRIITVDAAGVVKVHDAIKSFTLKYPCAGNSKKVLRVDSRGEKLFYINGQDRSMIIEVDLKVPEFKYRERKFTFGKLIDFVITYDDTILTVLAKDGWVGIKDLTKKDNPPVMKVKVPQEKSAKSPSPSRGNLKEVKKPEFKLIFSSDHDPTLVASYQLNFHGKDLEYTALAAKGNELMACVFEFTKPKQQEKDKKPVKKHFVSAIAGDSSPKVPADEDIFLHQDGKDREEEMPQTTNSFLRFDFNTGEIIENYYLDITCKNRYAHVFSFDWETTIDGHDLIVAIGGAESHGLYLLRTDTRQPKRVHGVHRDDINYLKIDHSQGIIYTASNDGTLCITHMYATNENGDQDAEIIGGGGEYDVELGDFRDNDDDEGMLKEPQQYEDANDDNDIDDKNVSGKNQSASLPAQPAVKPTAPATQPTDPKAPANPTSDPTLVKPTTTLPPTTKPTTLPTTLPTTTKPTTDPVAPTKPTADPLTTTKPQPSDPLAPKPVPTTTGLPNPTTASPRPDPKTTSNPLAPVVSPKNNDGGQEY